MVGWANRCFLDLVGTDHPIVQAPMAAASGVELCVAAIQGGALGSLPCALLSADQARAQVAEVRERAGGPLNLNFFCHRMPEPVDDSAWRALLRTYYEEYGLEPADGGALRMPFDDEMCAVVEQVRPEVVSFHFGLPEAELLRRVKAAGAVVIGCATSVEESPTRICGTCSCLGRPHAQVLRNHSVGSTCSLAASGPRLSTVIRRHRSVGAALA